MKEVFLYVEDVCRNRIYTRSDGNVLYRKIDDALIRNDIVFVDFGGKEIASESFLDEAVVEHYFNPKKDNVKDRIILKNVARHDKILLKSIYNYRKSLLEKERKKAIRKTKKR